MRQIVFIFLTFTLLFAFKSEAQQLGPNISFEKTSHNYGTMKESDGAAKYKFMFTNTGSEPLIIQNVKPSCGCTSSDWTKNPVPPGGQGYVTAEYNPKNRPGKFSKSIRITTNAEPPTSILRISGEVIAKEKGITELYPASVGELRMKTSHLAFMKTFNHEKKTETVEVYNNAPSALNVEFNNVPDFITIEMQPKLLKPKEEGKFIVSYDATMKDDWGFVLNRLNVVTIDENNQKQEGKLTVSAKISEDFSKLTPEELENAPAISFENQTFAFGEIKQGESVSHEYKFTNTGKTDLIIRKTKASCGCTAIMPTENVIKPGKSSSIKMTFNSKGKKGSQNKTITVYSNDPKKSELKLRIKGTILE